MLDRAQRGNNVQKYVADNYLVLQKATNSRVNSTGKV